MYVRYSVLLLLRFFLFLLEKNSESEAWECWVMGQGSTRREFWCLNFIFEAIWWNYSQGNEEGEDKTKVANDVK